MQNEKWDGSPKQLFLLCRCLFSLNTMPINKIQVLLPGYLYYQKLIVLAVFLAAWSLQIEKKPKLALHRGVFGDIFEISLFSLLFRRVFN